MSDVLRTEIAKLQLEPTDTLIVRVPHPCSDDAIRNIRDSVVAATKESVSVMVLRDGIELSVLSQAKMEPLKADDERRRKVGNLLQGLFSQFEASRIVLPEAKSDAKREAAIVALAKQLMGDEFDFERKC